MTPKIWTPQPRQILFLENPAFEVLFGGAKGPGKTDALLADPTPQLKIPDFKAKIFRRTNPRLLDLIDRSYKHFHGKFGAHWDGEKKRWIWPNRSYIQFCHCQNETDKWNHQGQECHWMGFDQIEEFTQTQYEFLFAQVRSSNPNIKCYVRATSNPGNVGHAWVKSRFIDKLGKNGEVKFFVKPSPDQDEIECSPQTPKALSRSFIFSNVYDNDFIVKNDPMYVSRLESLPAVQRRAFLLGDWDAFEGQFFQEFDRNIHVVSRETFKQMCQQMPVKRFCAMDYGFRNPSSVGWYAVFPDGNMIRYRELYKEGLTYQSLANEILRLSGDETIDYLVVDPAIQGDKSHHVEPKDGTVKGKSGYDTLNEIVNGRFSILLADNRRVVGWNRVRDLFKPYLNQHNKPVAMLQFTEDCRNLIRTLPGLVFDETNPEDLNTDGEDHAMDEVRYGVMSRPEAPNKPPEPFTPEGFFWGRVKKDISSYKDEESSDDESGSEALEEGSAIITG